MKLTLCMLAFFMRVVLAAAQTTVSLSETEAPKPSVYFAGLLGGISHTAWVLEILEVLRGRGYNVSYVSYESNRKYLSNYPEINFIRVQDVVTKVQFRDMFDAEQYASKKQFNSVGQYLGDSLPQQSLEFVDIMEKSRPALMICDHLAWACFNAAHKLKIPVAITSTILISQEPPDQFVDVDYIDSDDRNMSFGERIASSFKYLAYKCRLYRNAIPLVLYVEYISRQVNVPRFKYASKNSGAVQIINQMFPIEMPHALDPAEHYIGPIFISNAQPLTDKLETFLNTHSNVVYIAFGQMYVPTQHEFNALVLGLLDNYYRGIIDGFIWATVGLPTSMITNFEANYTTSRLTNNPDLMFEKWVPQYSILNHTSTKMFISHGGTASTHEAVFNGVPILAHPFTSDQPANALQLEKAGIALVNDRKKCTAESVSRKIRTIMKDRREEFVTKSNELRNLAHIASRKKDLAADILEQQLLCSRNGKPWYYIDQEQYWRIFAPSWRKLALALIAMRVSPLLLRSFRRYISQKMYARQNRSSHTVYTKSKKLN